MAQTADRTTAPIRRALILETSASGHRLVYVKLIIEEALSRGISIVLATGENVLTDDRFETHLGSLRSKVELAIAPSRVSVRTVQQLAIKNSCDAALVPDVLKYGIRMQVGKTYEAPVVRSLVMNDPRWNTPATRSLHLLQSAKLALLERSGRRPGVNQLWLRPQGSVASPSTVIDPLILHETPEVALARSKRIRERLQMSSTTFWFGVVGGLDSRKNIPLVVEALKRAAHLTDAPLGLALLGPWANESTRLEVSELLRGVPFARAFANQVLSNEEVNAMVGALDCAVMAYSTNAPNSTTAKAAALGVRVIVAGSATFRKFAAPLVDSLGVPLDAGYLADEMLMALDRPRPTPKKLTGPEGLAYPLLNNIPVIKG